MMHYPRSGECGRNADGSPMRATRQYLAVMVARQLERNLRRGAPR